MNDTIMAEEMQPEKKVAFVNRPYNNEERIKKEEEELEQMLKEQRGEVEETSEEVEAEPTSAEEKTFKKRYSDLRRHQQKQAEEFKLELASLKKQLSDATKKEMKLPKSDEDLEDWAKITHGPPIPKSATVSSLLQCLHLFTCECYRFIVDFTGVQDFFVPDCVDGLIQILSLIHI